MILKTNNYIPPFFTEPQYDCITEFRNNVKLDRSNLICIAARPGMGKTSLALHMALEFAKKSNKKVYIFSLELTAEQIYSRMVSYLAEVDTYSIREHKCSKEQAEQIMDAVAKLKLLNIEIDDEATLTVKQIEEHIHDVDDLGMIVVDYLQLITADSKYQKREQELDEISRALKALTQKLNVPIIVISTLWRGVERREEKRPGLYDLGKTGGFIEVAADTVIFPYREEYYDFSNSKDDYTEAEICIAKNRYDSTSTLKYKWQGRFLKFSEMD